MYPEHGFLLFFLAIAIFFFVRSYNYGVVGMLWGFTGLVAGIAGGFFFYKYIPVIFPEWDGSFRLRLLASAGVGMIPYFAVHNVAKIVFTRLFEEGGPLSRLSIGIGGGLLSLIPTAITIFIIIGCIRVTGTVAEFRRYEKLSIDGVDYLTQNYPGRPLFAIWRDGLERLPLIRPLYDAIDPMNRVPERNVVGLLITTKKEKLWDHLVAAPESGPIAVSDAFLELKEDEEINELRDFREHFKLLGHERVREVAADAEIVEELRQLELHTLVDAFNLSPDRQGVLESFQGRGR